VEGHIFNSSPTLSTTRSPAGTRSHLQEFILADGRRLYDPDPDWEIEGELSEDYRRVKLSRLHPGEQFAYVSNLGDDWAHLCTAGARRIDPAEVLGILPETPLPYRGWGDIPDQYRHRWDSSVRGGSRPAGLWRPPLHDAAHPGDLIVVIDAGPGVCVAGGGERSQDFQVLLKLGQSRAISEGLMPLMCVSVLRSHGRHLLDAECDHERSPLRRRAHCGSR
jgi:hypothetical protein